MTIHDIAQSCLDTLPECALILDDLPACPSDCPHKAKCDERQKALDAVLMALVDEGSHAAA